MILDLPGRLLSSSDNTINGYLKYRDNGHEFEIENIFIRRSRRKKGYALQMLDYLSNKNPERNLILEVSVLNLGAVSCYLKAGFKKNRVRKNYYQDGSDALEMIKVSHQSD